jgi:hypothetical protein
MDSIFSEGPHYQLIDHVCKHCMGRLLTRQIDDSNLKTLEIKCADCGASAVGNHEKICCCGIDAGSYNKPFECVVNPQATPEFPSQIIVRERETVVTAN